MGIKHDSEPSPKTILISIPGELKMHELSLDSLQCLMVGLDKERRKQAFEDLQKCFPVTNEHFQRKHS